MISVSTEVSFEAAHHLPMMPEGHKCKRLHGHNWRVVITCEGPLDERGMVIDYYEIEKAWALIYAEIDHRLLNEIPGLDNPTTEILASWLWARLSTALPLHAIDVYETPRMHCRILGAPEQEP